MRLPKFRGGKYPLRLPEKTKAWFETRARLRSMIENRNVSAADLYNEALDQYMKASKPLTQKGGGK